MPDQIVFRLTEIDGRGGGVPRISQFSDMGSAVSSMRRRFLLFAQSKGLLSPDGNPPCILFYGDGQGARIRFASLTENSADMLISECSEEGGEDLYYIAMAITKAPLDARYELDRADPEEYDMSGIDRSLPKDIIYSSEDDHLLF